MSQISSHSDSYEYQSGKIKAGRYRRRTSSGEKFIVGKDAVKEIRRRSLNEDQDPILTINQKRASVDKDGRRYSLEDKPNINININENNQRRRSSLEKNGRDRDRKHSIEKDRINENESVANDNLNDNNEPYGNNSVSEYQGSEFGPKKPLPKKFITEKEVEKEYKRDHKNELEHEHHHHHHDHRRHSHQDRNRDREKERERRRSSGERDRELLLEKKVADKYDTGAGAGAGGKAHHHHHHHHREYHHRNYKKLLFPWPFANPKPSVQATCKINKVDVAASAKSLKPPPVKEVIKIVEVVKPVPEKEFILTDHTTSVSRSFQPPLVRIMEVNDDELEAIEKKTREGSQGSDIRNDDLVATDYVKGDDCPFCGQGKFKLKFTWTGIMAAILLFPCGIYCCFKCRVQVCTYCGVSPM